MLHGYHHDEPDGHWEFGRGGPLAIRVADGRKYLEDLLGTAVRVFVPPRNAIGPQGLRAVAAGGLHLGGVAGVRTGWPRLSARTWQLWWQLRRWRLNGGAGVPWVLDLGDHREIAGTPVTPVSPIAMQAAHFDAALKEDGVFCAATHYWEFGVASQLAGEPEVAGQLDRLVRRARTTPGVIWQSVGDVLSMPGALM
jgi:hypothetical protein